MNLKEFKNKIEQENIVIVDFWAVWCAPCRALNLQLEKVYKQTKTPIIKINIDQQEDIVEHYQIQSVPTVIIFKEGIEVDRMIGLRPAEQYIESVNHNR